MSGKIKEILERHFCFNQFGILVKDDVDFDKTEQEILLLILKKLSEQRYGDYVIDFENVEKVFENLGVKTGK